VTSATCRGSLAFHRLHGEGRCRPRSGSHGSKGTRVGGSSGCRTRARPLPPERPPYWRSPAGGPRASPRVVPAARTARAPTKGARGGPRCVVQNACIAAAAGGHLRRCPARLGAELARTPPAIVGVAADSLPRRRVRAVLCTARAPRETCRSPPRGTRRATRSGVPRRPRVRARARSVVLRARRDSRRRSRPVRLPARRRRSARVAAPLPPPHDRSVAVPTPRAVPLLRRLAPAPPRRTVHARTTSRGRTASRRTAGRPALPAPALPSGATRESLAPGRSP
jgi:hypothetical protein